MLGTTASLSFPVRGEKRLSCRKPWEPRGTHAASKREDDWKANTGSKRATLGLVSSQSEHLPDSPSQMTPVPPETRQANRCPWPQTQTPTLSSLGIDHTDNRFMESLSKKLWGGEGGEKRAQEIKTNLKCTLCLMDISYLSILLKISK